MTTGSTERKVYNKIVRDRIPDIIAAKGGRAETEIVESAETVILLKQKLVEEAQEIMTADPEHLAEELADLMEVIRAIADETKISLDDIEQKRIAKLQERGGFTKHIKLISS